MNDQQQQQQFPDVKFLVNYSGITVVSPGRLNSPRIIPFERVKGRCEECKSTTLEIDYAIQAEGVTVICSRMKRPIFINFDKVEPLEANKCYFRVRFQGRTLDIPYKPAETESNDETATAATESG